MMNPKICAAALLFVSLTTHVGCTDSDTDQVSAPNIEPQIVTIDTLRNRLRSLVDSSIDLKSDDEFQNWVSQRWDDFADQGPLKHLPIQRAYADQPWPDNDMNVYVARYPKATALNIMDFHIFTWYTSSIQQDLIRDGNADLQYFYPEDKDDGVARLMNFVRSSDILTDHDSIIDKLRGFRLPPDMAWVHDLKYNSAIVAAGADGIEVVADSDDGYLTIIALDG